MMIYNHKKWSGATEYQNLKILTSIAASDLPVDCGMQKNQMTGINA